MLHVRVNEAAIKAIILTLTQIRIGEAKNPGPDHQPGLTLGAVNPTGLLRKSTCFSQLPAESNVIYGICETHLSHMGIRKFKSELRFANKNLTFFHGAPAPYRSQAISAVGGTHVGTGFATSMPSRKIQMHCTEDIWNQARMCLNTFLCNDVWIHGAVVYGFAHRAYSTEVRNATDELLQVATTHIVQNMKGPRFIMGDFNQEDGLLQQPQIWQKLGWQEVQHLHQARFGDPVQKTCKQSTTKDFIWLSPELVQYFRCAEVINHVFPEHGALLAHFHFFGHDTFCQLWRQPKPIPWEDIKGPNENGCFSLPDNITPDNGCILVANEFENRVHASLLKEGKPGLFYAQRGRCQTLHTQKIKSLSKPIKASRNGDLRPEFQGQCVQHQKWFTQLRRLESLQRLYRARPWNSNQSVHAQREWRAVLNASGFSSFRRWWYQLPSKADRAPTFLPDSLPNEQELSAICLTVHAEVRWFEKMLQTDLITKAKNNRVLNPNKVFQDFAKPSVSPVCILLDEVAARITEVDHDDNSITLDRQSKFWDGELITHAGPATPIIICDDKVWLDSIDGLVPGQPVRQERFVGQLNEMFNRFQHEWQKRWDRHLDVPDEQWSPLTDFFCLARPPAPEMTYTPITRDLWTKALKRKKPRAKGPDGWTRQDLLQLPLDLTDAILDMLHGIEAGTMQWPRQWLVGIIHSLEKHEQPAAVTGYRPITIFSLIYRTWASIRSRQLLSHLVNEVSSYSFGNLPQRCTTNMWMYLQQEIETNHACGLTTCGAVLDVVKCFNHLPRLPLFGVLKHLGAPPPILRAWAQALTSMERRFSIRGSVGEAIKSTTGFAEGCSLSVVAMVGANELVATWMAHKAPTTNLISFVDNLELFCRDPHELMRSTQKLEEILSLLDLEVDKSKTYLWSTHGNFRKVFLNNGFNVKTAARDIGAHLQYSRQATNFTITSKIESFKNRWKSLALSPATYNQKLRAVKAVAYPNMLHGIASAHVGDPWYEDIRTAAVRALGEHKPGCSPPLHLSLFEHPSADPGYHALWTTICVCRQYLDPEVCWPQFSYLVALNRKKPDVGPCAVLLHRLSKINWSWDHSGFFRDVWGNPVDLWDLPLQDLAIRVTEAWRYKVACDVASRQTFVGLANCDAAFTLENMTPHARDRAIMRSAMNGTFYTADHLKHRDTPGDTRCKLCYAEDSLYHRNWECPALEHCRQHVSPAQKSELLSMEPATYLQGWFPVPTTLSQFRQKLQQLPDFTACGIQNKQPISNANALVHYFTDGSCMHPHDKFTRVCGWGVVRASPTDMWDFQPVASGCLPGRHQTIIRAEIVAAASAAHEAVKEGHPFCIWSDNKRVVSLLTIMLSNPDRVWGNKTCNHDVVNMLASTIRDARDLFQGVYKVASHQQVTAINDPVERWCFQGNESADRLAAQAFQSQPDLMRCWVQLCHEMDARRDLRNAMHKLLLSIGLECLVKIQKQSPQHPPAAKQRSDPIDMSQWMLPAVLPLEAKPYMIKETPAVIQWITNLHDPHAPVQRWSWWQLFLDAWLNIPEFGPWHHVSQKCWKSGATQPPETFQRKARWFSKYLAKLFKACTIDLPMRHAMPCGSAIAFWTSTLTVRAPVKRTEILDIWFSQFFPCAVKTADLRTINM